jgi:hypothetical protein
MVYMEAVAEAKRDLEELQAASRHDHDLAQELSNRVAALWHYGECILSAEGKPEVQQVWRDLQCQELAAITQLKQLIASRIEKGEFLQDL